MQEREVVAAVVAGDPDGLAAAYDQFGAPLYAYCHLMLPDPDAAADAVRDTFLIATARLGGLSDPDRLGSWLYAVTRNECLRRLRAAGITSRPPKVPSDGALAGIELPAGLRGQVIKACTDNTPAGRARRASAAHRAGSFGPTGFPKAIGSPGPQWWRRVRRHPRAAAVATVAAAAAAAGVVVMLTVGASHRTQASIVALGGGIPGGSAGPASSGGPSAAASHRASPTNGQPKPSVTAPGSLPSPDPSTPPTGPGTQPPSAPASLTSSSAAPSASSPSPSPSPSASPSSSRPTEGTLEAVPNRLALTSTKGKAVSGTFLLSAVDGPVGHYSISVPAAMAAKVKVAPAQGSLAAGGWVTVTVTVTSKVAINTTITVYPGAIAVTVLLSVKA